MRDPQKKYEKIMAQQEELERGAEAWEELRALFWGSSPRPAENRAYLRLADPPAGKEVSRGHK